VEFVSYNLYENAATKKLDNYVCVILPCFVAAKASPVGAKCLLVTEACE